MISLCNSAIELLNMLEVGYVVVIIFNTISICMLLRSFKELTANSCAVSWQWVKRARPLVLGGILALSYCRTLSLFHGYSAPMQAYRHLPPLNANTTSGKEVVYVYRYVAFDVINVCRCTFLTSIRVLLITHFASCKIKLVIWEDFCWNAEATVCIGDEWHRFPSSFFLPSSHYHVAWLNDGFTGLLPRPFDPALGGTTAAPRHFNSKNKASADQFVCTDISRVYPFHFSFHVYMCASALWCDSN